MTAKKATSFFMAQHPFATLFLNEEVTLKILSKMLVQKNITTTQIYIKILNKKVGKGMLKGIT
ncbi:site-specific integrase [Sphingobacterium rhinopitheci]|uniref:hypothetical protein n=1 Tax=Sphingobacterium rhinopitheci TaxID=2781960 RepID=UPI001F528404|nr:hypothetical protein [Sphingobacterium rhinopitheci]MCI0919974.1 hypothetical protein [Sphingobacterium rhinopitheci]